MEPHRSADRGDCSNDRMLPHAPLDRIKVRNIQGRQAKSIDILARQRRRVPRWDVLRGYAFYRRVLVSTSAPRSNRKTTPHIDDAQYFEAQLPEPGPLPLLAVNREGKYDIAGHETQLPIAGVDEEHAADDGGARTV